jgi:hypothetical protein
MAKKPERIFSPSAAVLAWLWPGLGHISLGQRRRGALIMFGVLFLVISGLLIGGLDCVDRKHEKLWFLAQSLCGPIVFAADFANQHLVQVIPQDWLHARDRDELLRRYREGDPAVTTALPRIGISHVNEMGTLFVALAGLMNAVVILDALYYVPRSEPPPRRREADA